MENSDIRNGSVLTLMICPAFVLLKGGTLTTGLWILQQACILVCFKRLNGCSSLISVTILDGVTSIGDNAFDGCSSLTSVTIPDSVTSIARTAFSTYQDGEYISNPSLTVIASRGSYAVQYCEVEGIKYTYPDALD